MIEALILCRLAHFASAMALFGASLFVGALAPMRLVPRLQPPMRRLAVGSAIIAFASCVAWLMLEAGEMGEGWHDAVDLSVIASVLTDTAFGFVWIARLALGLALIVMLIELPAQWNVTAVLSGLFLASLGLVDHAAMHEGALGFFERANQALHLVCGGFWIGSLAPLLICLPLLGDGALKSEAGISLRRFSGLGHFAVAGVVLTGVVNTSVILGRLPTDFASPYQFLLSVKVLLVVIMVMLAIFNRYYLVPRLPISPASSVKALSVSTFTEIALGAAVLGLVSTFALLEPR